MKKLYGTALTGVVMMAISFFGMVYPTDANGGKIWICHVDAPPSENMQAIEISQAAWENPGQGSHSPGAHGGDFGPISGPNDPSCGGEPSTATSVPHTPTSKSPTETPTDVPPTATNTVEVTSTPSESPTPGTTPTEVATQGSTPTATSTAQSTSEPQPSSTPHPVAEPPTGGGSNLLLPVIGLLGALLTTSSGLGIAFGKPD